MSCCHRESAFAFPKTAEYQPLHDPRELAPAVAEATAAKERIARSPE
jgi:hypothetical protein